MRKIIIWLAIGAIVVSCIIFKNYFETKYYILFQKDGIIGTYDKLNRLNGDVIIFKNGIIQKEETFKNGKREGWSYTFTFNKKIESKRYYHLDNLNGPEFHYYPNGQLNYKGFIKNNKRFGNFYWYSNDGILESYSCFDIKGNAFSTFEYNKLRGIIKISSPISSTTYSIDTKMDTTVLLTFDEKHKNVKDLFITVATPPNTSLKIKGYVNNVYYSDLKVIENTIKITNAFPNKGLNKIYLKVNLFYRGKTIINGLNVDLSILKE